MAETLAVDGAGASPDGEEHGQAIAQAAEEVDKETAEADDSTAEAESGEQNESGLTDEEILVREGDVAGDYLERLLDILDYDGDIDLDVEAGRAMVSIQGVEGGNDLDKLVGQRGQVLEALQELTRLAVQTETSSRSRLMLDIAGWRASRRGELTDLGRSTAEKVAENGESVKMKPMTPFERKIVHDAVADVDGVTSESEGEEPNRCVVVVPES